MSLLSSPRRQEGFTSDETHNRYPPRHARWAALVPCKAANAPTNRPKKSFFFYLTPRRPTHFVCVSGRLEFSRSGSFGPTPTAGWNRLRCQHRLAAMRSRYRARGPSNGPRFRMGKEPNFRWPVVGFCPRGRGPRSMSQQLPQCLARRQNVTPEAASPHPSGASNKPVHPHSSFTS